MAAVAHNNAVDPNEVIKQAIDNLGCQAKSNWVPIPSFADYCVEEIAKFAVREFNKLEKGNFTFNSIDCGWYFELKGLTLLFHLHIKVSNCLGASFLLEVVVSQSLTIFGDKFLKLETFKLIPIN